jgi:hypothetical protein
VRVRVCAHVHVRVTIQSACGKFYFCDYGECPERTDLENALEDVFTDNAIESITFEQWIFTGVN